MAAADTGGEPFWVVVADMGDDEYASAAVDAPNVETAETEGERVIVGNEGRKTRRIARVTGPFPNDVPTEDRERRPKMCAGCGLKRFCGNHAPTPFQTWWTVGTETEKDIGWKCVNCETRTFLPKDGNTLSGKVCSDSDGGNVGGDHGE